MSRSSFACTSSAVLLLLLSMSFVSAHVCFHDELMAKYNNSKGEPMKVQYPDHLVPHETLGRGFKTQATFENMRVTVVWDPEGTGSCQSTGQLVNTYTGSQTICQEDDVLTNIRKDYVINTLMARSKEWIQNALRVVRVSGNLVVSGSDSCRTDGLKFPSADQSTGQADTDFLIYVTAVPMSNAESATVAWALACRFDSTTGRPLVGHVNWVPRRLSNAETGNAVKEAEDVQTGIHEIMHALGFSNPYFDSSKGYLLNDGSGGYSGSSNSGISESTSSTLGKTIKKLISPRVVAKAREYFGCNTLDGLEIEDQGGSGTALSHWEKRVMYQDVMMGVGSNTKTFISPMTLAFFEDTGHYEADYAYADIGMNWGKGQGCDFLTTKCISGGSASFGEFCTETNPYTRLCTHDRLAIGQCDVGTYQSALPNQYQYFTDSVKGAVVATGDYCPAVIPFSNTKCIDSANVDGQDIYGNDYTSSSRCYDSNLIEIQYSSSDSGARCFITSCTASGAIEISIEGKTCPCPTDGSAGPANTDALGLSFKGYINCPKASLVCNSADFAPPTPAPPTPVPTPLPPGETYAPTRLPPTPPPSLSPDCANRRTCADQNNIPSMMPGCRQVADEVVDCFGTNCDSEMIAWLTDNGFATECQDEVAFADKCQEGKLGAEDICYLVRGGTASVSATLVLTISAFLVTFFTM